MSPMWNGGRAGARRFGAGCSGRCTQLASLKTCSMVSAAARQRSSTTRTGMQAQADHRGSHLLKERVSHPPQRIQRPRLPRLQQQALSPYQPLNILHLSKCNPRRWLMCRARFQGSPVTVMNPRCSGCQVGAVRAGAGFSWRCAQLASLRTCSMASAAAKQRSSTTRIGMQAQAGSRSSRLLKAWRVSRPLRHLRGPKSQLLALSQHRLLRLMDSSNVRRKLPAVPHTAVRRHHRPRALRAQPRSRCQAMPMLRYPAPCQSRLLSER
mmetsp:Transcript_60164/g.154917  ORF Transcript_60164/g.154917 Transcript_60164/m.154917 type:complete len:267 (-) Transcript_60164:910-1710(-)